MNKLFLITIFAMLLLIPFSFALTPLSISSVGFDSNDPDLQGQAWLVTFALRGDNSFIGTISAEDIKSDDGKIAENDLTISAELTSNSCNYNLRTRSADPNVFEYGVQIQEVSQLSFIHPNIVDFGNQCISKSNYYFVYGVTGTGFLQTTMYCITKDRVGVPATVETPIENFEADIQVIAKGQTSTGTINSVDSNSVNIPPVAFATWVGSFSSGETCPDIAASGFVGMNGKNGNWILIRQTTYNSYLNSLDNFQNAENRVVDEIFGDGLTSSDQSVVDDYIGQINTVNSRARSTQGEVTFSTSSGKQASVSGSLSNGKVNIDLERSLSTPVITAKIDADFLGIFIPVGQPEIVALSASPFTEGTNGNIQVSIRNVGDVSSKFSVGASCSSPFSTSSTIRETRLLSPNQQETINIPISATTNDATQTGTCTVSVFDAERPQDRVTQSITVSVSCLQICNAGETRCNLENKEECSSNSCSWVDLGESNECKETCSSDVDCFDNNACTSDKCVSNQCQITPLTTSECTGVPPPPPPNECKEGETLVTKEKKIGALAILGIGVTETTTFCKKPSIFGDLDINQTIITIFISLLSGLILFLILSKFFGKDDKTLLAINIIISVLVALLIGFILFQFYETIILGAAILVTVLLIVWIILKAVF